MRRCDRLRPTVTAATASWSVRPVPPAEERGGDDMASVRHHTQVSASEHRHVTQGGEAMTDGERRRDRGEDSEKAIDPRAVNVSLSHSILSHLVHLTSLHSSRLSLIPHPRRTFSLSPAPPSHTFSFFPSHLPMMHLVGFASGDV